MWQHKHYVILLLSTTIMEKTMQNNEKQSQPPQSAQPQQANFGPAPVDPNTPYQQQPVNQQYFAQPQAAPVQYVVMAESLKGVKGWLLFFTISFALVGVAYITAFFNSMLNLDGASAIITLIFAPVIAAAAITTTVLIAMQKKLGKWLAIGTIGFLALYILISNIVAFATDDSSTSSAPVLISIIISNLVFDGLYMLYFFTSKRVKETLVN